jgi:uncharacterized protein (TIGR02246 family)
VRIARRRNLWTAAVNARDVQSYLELLAEDLVWIPPGQQAIHGRDAFASWVEPFFRQFEYDFALTAEQVRVAGDWAVERGTFHTMMTSPEGRSAHHAGDYIVWWRRDVDDVWRIERYVDTTSS